jgi:hypothetical protein
MCLGAFAELRKAIISFVMSADPSAHMEKLGFQLTNFLEILYWRIFRKSVKQIQVVLKLDESNGHFT